MTAAPDAQAIRVDKWLFHARFFRSRGIAAQVVEAGRLRINGRRTTRRAAIVRPGDVLTFPQGGEVRVVRILDPGRRRGPAEEARTLYEVIPEASDQPLEPRPGAP